MRRSRVVVLLALLVALPSVASGQQDMGAITGIVTDSSGAVLPGVTVTARDEETGITISITTNETGLFVIAPLKIGTYAVEAALAGFKKSIARDVSHASLP